MKEIMVGASPQWDHQHRFNLNSLENVSQSNICPQSACLYVCMIHTKHTYIFSCHNIKIHFKTYFPQSIYVSLSLSLTHTHLLLPRRAGVPSPGSCWGLVGIRPHSRRWVSEASAVFISAPHLITPWPLPPVRSAALGEEMTDRDTHILPSSFTETKTKQLLLECFKQKSIFAKY